MPDKLILIGGGGHCKACIDVIESSAKYEIEGILDSGKKNENTVLKYKIIGDDSLISNFTATHLFLITVGYIKNAQARIQLYTTIKSDNGKLATIFSSEAYISKYAHIGEGTIIMHHCCVNANATIGDNCIINNKALVEHDAVIANHCHISTGAIVNGNCIVGECVFIGSNAVLIQGVTIAPGTIIGAGAVVRKDIKNPGTYTGNPARKIR